jgi:hypothetical protein
MCTESIDIIIIIITFLVTKQFAARVKTIYGNIFKRCESNWYKLAFYSLFLYSLSYNQPNFRTCSITIIFTAGYSVKFQYKILKVKVKILSNILLSR